MNDLVIKVSKRSRLIDLDHSTLGIVGENLQEKLIFIFQDEFVDGMARLEYEQMSEKHYVLMDKVGQSYILPVKNILLTKEGNIDLQLVVTEDKTGTPVFKSEVFTLYCKKSIEAVGEAPSSYELWIETANRILTEASRLNIDGVKTGTETKITITRKSGEKKTFIVFDGKDGKDGEPGATGNGIDRIELTSSVGLVDTYTIYYTNGTTTTFQVTNGETQDLSDYVTKVEFEESQSEQDETIENLQSELDRYKLLENALPHVSNEMASDYVTLNNTAKAPMEIETIPQTSQDGEPTPDYPQEIHCTTGEQKIKIVNANLLNVDNSEEGGIDASGTEVSGDTLWRGNEFIKVLPNTAYTFSSNKSMTLRLYQYDENYTFILPREEARSNTFLTITTGSSTRYLKFSIYDNGTRFTKNLVKTYDLQIEQSSTVSSYEPHQEQTYPISLGNKEMFNINGVYDGFVYDESVDKFYFRRWNRKIELAIADMNNSENYPGWKNIAQVKADFPEGAIPLGRDYDYLCNIHKKSVYGIYIDNRNLSGNIYLNKDTFNLTQSQWKTNYPNLVVILIYNLKNYVDEEITDTTLISQLRAIKNALSMQGTTHIISTATGENLPFLIKARAVQTIERT